MSSKIVHLEKLLYFANMVIVLLLITMILGYLYRRYARPTYEAYFHSRHDNNANDGDRVRLVRYVGVALVLALTYAVFYVIISSSWLTGDEWAFLGSKNLSFTGNLKLTFDRYMGWVSRFGNFLGFSIKLSENRWEHVLITPLLITLLPIAVHRLVAPKGKTIFSVEGVVFIVFFVALFSVSDSLKHYRVFWDFAASVNYLWPLIFIAFFLSFFRKDRGVICDARWYVCVFLFLLGVYSGWSLECISCLLLPGLLVWSLWQLRKKKGIPQHLYFGVVGVIWGAVLLFASPANKCRMAIGVRKRAFDPTDMSFWEIFNFTLDQSPENMAKLSGGAVSAVLEGIPLPLHAMYVPSLMKIWMAGGLIALIICAILMGITAIRKHDSRKNTLLFGGAGMMLSMLCACSYLYAGIPLGMSFFPATFIMACTASFLYLRLDGSIGKFVQGGLALLVLSYAIYGIAPSVAEALTYKKYEKKRWDAIYQQVDAGVKNVVLPPSYPQPPQDKLGLISRADLSENPKKYPNTVAAKYFGIRTISVKRHKVEKR